MNSKLVSSDGKSCLENCPSGEVFSNYDNKCVSFVSGSGINTHCKISLEGKSCLEC